MDSLVQELLYDLTCATCMQYMLPPITLCTNGHNICHSCKTTLKHCPTCLGKLIDTRSRAAERLSNHITHPCKYRNSGCTAQCLLDFKEEHEKECFFQPFKCPGALSKHSCLFEGPLHDMKEHIKDSHSLSTCTNINPMLIYSVIEESKPSLSFVFIFDEILLIFSKQVDSFLHKTVMLVGRKEQAENFKYRVTMKSEDNEQSMSVCLPCRSYLELFEKRLSFSDERSAIFPNTFCKKCILVIGGKEIVPCELEIMRSTSLETKVSKTELPPN